MTPVKQGNTILLMFLPATPFSPSRTLERLFELTWRPSRAIDPLILSLLEGKYINGILQKKPKQ